MAEVAILIPTRGRPSRLEPLVENIVTATPPVHRIVFGIDVDDLATGRELERLAMDHPAIVEAMCPVVDLPQPLTYPQKINLLARLTHEPWLLATADDVRFAPGWWEATAEARADPDVGVIGTNDLHHPCVLRGEWATQILIGRDYWRLGTIDEPEAIFHEGYHHEGVDVELCETARARGAYRHVHGSVIEHLHPAFGGRAVDDTDRRGNLRGRAADAALLDERRRLWLR